MHGKTTTKYTTANQPKIHYFSSQKSQALHSFVKFTYICRRFIKCHTTKTSSNE